MISADAAGGATPVRAVVVDDEPSAREVIRSFVRREPGIEIVGEASNGIEAIERIRALAPDLLFLDVQMPDRDGFGVLEDLGDDVPPGVVFVTAHDQYALRAFDVHALDYLVKPFGYPRFHAAVERALRTLAAEAALETRRTIETMVRGQRERGVEAGTLETPAGGRAPGADKGEVAPADDAATLIPGRIGVRRGARTIIVDVANIDWVEAADDYCRLHVAEDTHLVSSRMHELEAYLAPHGFFRIHRSAIVRLARISELRRDPNGGGLAVLDDGVRLRVTRTRWDDLERALGLH